MKTAHLARWARTRDPSYVARRMIALGRRYGFTPEKGMQRATECVDVLSARGCYPTFATPGRVVEKGGNFFKELTGMGAEIAIHGYDHVDFRSLSPAEAENQFVRAANAFDRYGIPFDGFRCPYLSWTDGMLESLPDSRLRYSSNTAIWWDVIPTEEANSIFSHLWQFYRPLSSETSFSLPRSRGELVEIAASLPDDLQLVDGLGLGKEGLRRTWSDIVRRTHGRGDLFAPLFHPELFEDCRLAFENILDEARDLRPRVWVTQLRDVARWWRERETFTVERGGNGSRLRLRFDCSERATILTRNVRTNAPTRSWDGSYDVVDARELEAGGGERPLVGLAPSAPADTLVLLREHGYITDTSEDARECSIYLTPSLLRELATEVALVDFIESSRAPLVKFGRWPDEARSAFCVAGDLDALSLRDYAARIVH
jgi:peptidoglycan/xylan/chitin deacetylase (PgdA/CDA1 family)